MIRILVFLCIAVVVCSGRLSSNVQDGLGFGVPHNISGARPLQDPISMTAYSSWPKNFTKAGFAFLGGAYDGLYYLYLAPSNSKTIMRVDTRNGSMTGYSNWPTMPTISNVRSQFVTSFEGAVYDGKYVWLVPCNYEYVVRFNPATGNITSLDTWPENFTKTASSFRGGVFDGATIWLVPCDSSMIVRVNVTDGKMVMYGDWPYEINSVGRYVGGVYDGAFVWLIPCNANYVARVNVADGSIEAVQNWPNDYVKGANAFAGGAFDGVSMWMAPLDADSIVRVNTTSREMTAYKDQFLKLRYAGESWSFVGGVFDGASVWLVPYNHLYLVRIDITTGNLKAYNNFPTTKSGAGFVGGIYDGRSLWLIPFSQDVLVRVHTNESSTVSITHTRTPTMTRIFNKDKQLNSSSNKPTTANGYTFKQISPNAMAALNITSQLVTTLSIMSTPEASIATQSAASLLLFRCRVGAAPVSDAPITSLGYVLITRYGINAFPSLSVSAANVIWGVVGVICFYAAHALFVLCVLRLKGSTSSSPFHMLSTNVVMDFLLRGKHFMFPKLSLQYHTSLMVPLLSLALQSSESSGMVPFYLLTLVTPLVALHCYTLYRYDVGYTSFDSANPSRQGCSCLDCFRPLGSWGPPSAVVLGSVFFSKYRPQPSFYFGGVHHLFWVVIGHGMLTTTLSHAVPEDASPTTCTVAMIFIVAIAACLSLYFFIVRPTVISSLSWIRGCRYGVFVILGVTTIAFLGDERNSTSNEGNEMFLYSLFMVHTLLGIIEHIITGYLFWAKVWQRRNASTTTNTKSQVDNGSFELYFVPVETSVAVDEEGGGKRGGNNKRSHTINDDGDFI